MKKLKFKQDEGSLFYKELNQGVTACLISGWKVGRLEGWKVERLEG